MGILTGLEPARVLHYFEELCSIPHGSGNTKAISDYLVEFADDIAYFTPKQTPIYGTVFYTNRGMVYEYMRSIKWMENFIKYANEGTIT